MSSDSLKQESRMTPMEEGRALLDTLQALKQRWDAREKILEMRDEGCSHWRQMEWFGWYFEWRAKRMLTHVHGGGDGPSYGNSAIDYMREHPWDLKAHSMTERRGFASLNDVEAVDRAVAEHGGIGFLVASGVPTLDADGTFRAWHVRESGGESDYSMKRRAEGAPSRKRKSAWDVKEIVGFYLAGPPEVARALREGWLTNRDQVGRRNSNDAIRRAKYGAVVEEIPVWARL